MVFDAVYTPIFIENKESTMKGLQHRILSLLLFVFIAPQLMVAQESEDFELSSEINKVYDPIAISVQQLEEADSLTDIYHLFKEKWVKEYKSVEVQSIHNGKIQKSTSRSGMLSAEQKKIIQQADYGSEIAVNINYLPNNNLRQNEVKDFPFTFIVDPVNEAQFPGGASKMNQFIKKNLLDVVSKSDFYAHALSAVTFTINEKGEAVDAAIEHSSKSEEIDNLIVDLICKMPNWTLIS
ncbi:MAG: hypothetical protein AAF449_01840 [Myxococcota bacterium]